ncbi:MAG: SxtJ family membrane protein [Bacteroides sp.]|nr:SxtJ family membrane protein [Bacteroides sp.]
MKTEQTRYRETLLVIVLGFSILYLITDREWMLYVALGTGIAGMISMKLNEWIHRAWFFLGEKMGWVVSKVILGALYIVILLPVSTLARISRKEIMNLKSPDKSGYHQRDHLYAPDDLENMW